MLLKTRLIPLAVAFLALPTAAAKAQTAQNLQNWDAGQANHVQNEAASGMINQNQANWLEHQDGQIQAQEQRDLHRNGGYLTNQEKQKISSELGRVHQQLANDVRKDHSNLNFYNGYPMAAPPFWHSGINPNATVAPMATWPGGSGTAGVAPSGYQSTQQSQTPNGQYRHHHHHQDGQQNNFGISGLNWNR